jgi:hypothetical protein
MKEERSIYRLDRALYVKPSIAYERWQKRLPGEFCC